jgi:hypothetical protein
MLGEEFARVVGTPVEHEYDLKFSGSPIGDVCDGIEECRDRFRVVIDGNDE